MTRQILIISNGADAASMEESADVITTRVGVEKLTEITATGFDEIEFIGGLVPDEDQQTTSYNLLKPSGKMCVKGIPSREAGQALAVDLRIQGFGDIMAAKDPATSDRFLVCQKPNWEVGAAATLQSKEETVVQKPAEVAAVWKAAALSLTDDDVIDDDALLDASVPIPKSEPRDCGTSGTGGKKRACKDCTCGLKEEEAAGIASAKVTLSLEEKVAKSSSCGNCSKGDAFRCGSCPFLGKPAFQAGEEKVMLSLDDDF